MGQSSSSPVSYPPDFSLRLPTDSPTKDVIPTNISWSTTPATSSSSSFVHPSTSSTARPPPGCPMHESTAPPPPPAPKAAQCPVDHSQFKGSKPSSSKSDKPAQCPVDHGQFASSRGIASSSTEQPLYGDSLNPLNQMPTLSHQKAPNQTLDLPTERTSSSIPRPNSEEKVWEYPSPQQFYNALVRKGWETPEEHVETMVEIHNFLNEEAWQEVMKWEKRFPRGEEAQLAKFQGNPGKLSPKAMIHLTLGKVFPSKFITEPPFDRHDWLVTRPSPTSTDPNATTTTRYVIDYHSAPEDSDGNPTFFLDVRPALDSLESIKERIVVGVGETWREYSAATKGEEVERPTTKHV